jgi:hypothetical protein
MKHIALLITRWTAAAAALAVAAAPPVRAAEAAKPPAGPTVVTMTVRPQPTTRPALRVRLLPSLVDQTPGDAAPVYLLAAILANRQDDPWAKQVTDADAARFGLPSADGRDWTSLLLDAPLAKLRSADLDQYLAAKASVYAQMEVAGRRETCRWDVPLREQGFSTLLPHLAPLRGAASAVCVKARAELAKGDPDAALRTLQSNFALARALTQQAVLIQSLVAGSVAAQSLKVVREAAEVPGCPNLYWALADLPKPFLDLRGAMEWERAALQFTIPQLRKARQGTFTEDDWREVVEKLANITQASRLPGPTDRLGMAAAAAVMYPQARRYLLDRGVPAADVDATPPATVLARYMADSFDEVFDEMAKWASLPYWQGHAGEAAAARELADRQAKALIPNPVHLLVPSVGRAAFSVRRLDRDVAATQAVEAIRAHAATHGGTLPATLDEVTDTPVPLDPLTGKPFVYKVDGASATLDSPAPDGERPQDGLVVKVTIAK